MHICKDSGSQDHGCQDHDFILTSLLQKLPNNATASRWMRLAMHCFCAADDVVMFCIPELVCADIQSICHLSKTHRQCLYCSSAKTAETLLTLWNHPAKHATVTWCPFGSNLLVRMACMLQCMFCCKFFGGSRTRLKVLIGKLFTVKP